ncbi:antitoxin VapB family protein [Halovivax limisalsi]|uniref:antitoxin VapB family protein n=1 Tax=Halovivax limisalsi TaxID=1453760 RepID=UPI001FFC9C87|nr:antitoxin VapB family protein [Halovivax limisalsi]
MGTKTIGVQEDVYERLRARKREDESFTDLLDRLMDESRTDWRDTFGRLPDEDAADLEAAVQTAREQSSGGYADRQRRAIEAFADVGTDSTEGSDDT